MRKSKHYGHSICGVGYPGHCNNTVDITVRQPDCALGFGQGYIVLLGKVIYIYYHWAVLCL